MFCASSLKTYVISHLPYWPQAYFEWHKIAPPEHSGKAALAMLLGGTLWFPLNALGRLFRALRDEEAIRRDIDRKRDPLELFLRTALAANEMISVSVENGKVYIGYLTSNYNPAFPMESISLIPAFSGHRKDDTKELVLDLNYIEVYKAVQPDLHDKLLTAFLRELEENPKVSEDKFFPAVMQRLAFDVGHEYEIILPITQVQSANVFHVDTYAKHFTTQVFRMPAPAAPATAV